MREFLKLIVSIIVVIVISYTLYFFLESNAKYLEEHSDDEINKEDIILDNKKEDDSFKENDLLNPIVNPESKEEESGEVIPKESLDLEEEKEQTEIMISGEKKEDLSNIIAKINMIETKNRLANLSKTIEDNVGVDIVGQKNKEFFDILLEDNMMVTVQVAGTMVYIIPTPDLIDNAQYHYDANGKLALYICELVGIGGEIRYYYEDGRFLTKVANVEEINLEQILYEDSDEILTRANSIYTKYMK